MQIEFTVSGLKPTQRRRAKRTPKHRPVHSAVETIVLAYQIEQAVQDGRGRDYADVAQQLGLTRARVSQIIGLLRLPPAVLEFLLLADPTCSPQLTERQLRPLIAVPDPMNELENMATPKFFDDRLVMGVESGFSRKLGEEHAVTALCGGQTVVLLQLTRGPRQHVGGIGEAFTKGAEEPESGPTKLTLNR